MEYPDLNKRQIEVLTYIKQALRKQGYPPTVREIGQAVGLKSPATVHGHLRALEEKGYNPVNQIVGYILSEDPTYITNHNQARTLIRKVDRDELMQILVRNYLLK